MNFFYTGLNKKYIEYAQFCLEEKEKDFILDINNENKLTGIEINEKTNKIRQTIELSNKNMNKNFLSENDYNLFHDFAVSKGGFLNMRFRKEIYKKLLYYSNIPLNNICNIKLKVNSNNQNNNNNSQINSSSNKLPNNVIQNNPNNTNNNNNNTYFMGPYYMPQLRYFRNVWINKSTQKIYWSHDYLYQYLNPLKERQIIKVDVERCNINNYFPSNSHPYLNSFLKSKVESALNTIITFNKNEFKYYQGYNDIFMLFFYLYMDSPYTYISLFQRFSELYLKDNLSISDKNKGKGFNFPNCIKLCMTIMQELNQLAYNELVEYCKTDCNFVMPYIICLFTHNINNIFIKYRLLDYFLVSHPISVYVMTSLIVIDEITKIKTQYNMDKLQINTYNFFNSEKKNEIGAFNESNFFTHFQNLNFDEIDFETYIQKTEESLQNFNFDKIYNEFIGPNYQFKPYYPVISKEKYLKNLIKYDFEKGNDGGYNPLANLLFNNRFAKFVIEKSNKLYKDTNDKITNSTAYKTCNKVFPFAFFCSSILILPSIYIANYKSK